MKEFEPATEADIRIVQAQIGRVPRGMVGVAARAAKDDPLGVPAGEPLVVVTSPRVERRGKAPAATQTEPFPTTYYLTHPTYTAAASRLEASGYMKELEQLLTQSPELQADMQQAHRRYIEDRNALAKMLGVEDLTSTHADFSAGGMPLRVKCLHALLGHTLATLDLTGKSDNPLGDIALKRLQVF